MYWNPRNVYDAIFTKRQKKLNSEIITCSPNTERIDKFKKNIHGILLKCQLMWVNFVPGLFPGFLFYDTCRNTQHHHFVFCLLFHLSSINLWFFSRSVFILCYFYFFIFIPFSPLVIVLLDPVLRQNAVATLIIFVMWLCPKKHQPSLNFLIYF